MPQKHCTIILLAATVLSLIAAGAGWFAAPPQAQSTVRIDALDSPTSRAPTGNAQAAPGSCTIFTVSKSGMVFYGNNEDWINPNTAIWSILPTGDGFGGVFYGFDDLYPQGGVNEKGLAFDWNALPEMRFNPHRELPPAPDRFGEHLLARSATVEEAIAYISGLSWGSAIAGQIHLADASGNAAVMSAGTDGEWAVTRKEPGDGYLVSTNFDLVAPQAGGYPCSRFERATAMLEQTMRGGELTADQMANILDAVHQEGPTVNTVYANAIDLARGVIYLYHWYQFQEPFTITVDAAIDRFAEPTPIRALFSQAIVDRAEQAYQRHLGRIDLVQNAVKVWLVVLGISLAVQVLLSARQQDELWIERSSWILGAATLGPIALVVRVLDLRGTDRVAVADGRTVNWVAARRGAMVRAGGNSFALLLSIPYFIFVKPAPGPLDILVATYVVPLLFGSLILRGALYAARVGVRYRVGLRRLAVSELTAHNLTFGTMIPAFFLLSATWFSSGVDAANPLVWVAFALATLASGLAALPFEAWLTHRGIPLWPWKALGRLDADEPKSLDLRAGWPILAFSFAFASGLLILTVSQLF